MWNVGERQSTVVLETEEGNERRRRAYEAWVIASRKRARRECIMRRVLIGGGVLLGLLLLFGAFVAVSHGAPIGSGTETYPKTPMIEQSPRPQNGGLVEAEAKCKQSHGEWFVDDKSEGLPPGGKVIGCFWIVPKGMR